MVKIALAFIGGLIIGVILGTFLICCLVVGRDDK